MNDIQKARKYDEVMMLVEMMDEYLADDKLDMGLCVAKAIKPLMLMETVGFESEQPVYNFAVQLSPSPSPSHWGFQYDLH